MKIWTMNKISLKPEIKMAGYIHK